MYPPRFFGFALVAVLTAAFGGQALAQESSGPACVLGESVQVEWGASWYDATVIAGPNQTGQCEISYDGWSSMWNEWVGVDRMRGWTPVAPVCPIGALNLPAIFGLPYAASVVAGPDRAGECLVQYTAYGLSWADWADLESYEPPTLLCQPGTQLSVQSNGRWWNATAVSGTDTACRVHYDGWPSSRDETVGVSQLRPRSAAPAQPASSATYGPGTAPTSPSTGSNSGSWQWHPFPGHGQGGGSGHGHQHGQGQGQGQGHDHHDHADRDDCDHDSHDRDDRRGSDSARSDRDRDRDRDDRDDRRDSRRRGNRGRGRS